jgi:hypothetical protein
VIDWLGELSVFGSPRVQRLLRLGAALAGLLALGLVEALLVASWYGGVLSLWGVAALSLGLAAVVLLYLARHRRQRGRPLLPAYFANGFWSWRRKPGARAAPANGRKRSADGDGAAAQKEHPPPAPSQRPGEGRTSS